MRILKRTPITVPAMVVALAVAAWLSFAPPVFVASAQEEAGQNLECSSYCSSTRPGTPVMEVKWRVADQVLPAAEIRARVRQQKLEATVYSDGFERGLYVAVEAPQAKEAFRAPAPTARPGLIPALSRLVLTDVATRQDRQPREHLRLLEALPPQAEWVVVRIEGVESGMDYTYRVPGQTDRVTCRAAVCPVDSIRAAPPKPKPPKPGPQK